MKQIAKTITVYNIDRDLELYRRLRDMISKNDEATSQLVDHELEKAKNHLQRIKHGISGEPWDFTVEKSELIFAEDDTILITPLNEKYIDDYFSVRAENTIGVGDYVSDQDLRCNVWKSMMAEYTFPCAVIKKEDSTFVGYVNIVDTTASVWEISIELLTRYIGHGIGYNSLNLFLNQITALTGKHEFRFLVAPDNYACQKLMNKLNAQLIGLHQFYFADDNEAKQFGKSHHELITPQIEALATEIGCSAEDVISQVLDYRLFLDYGIQN